ncbi:MULTISPECIES: DUF4880 domain-containing protein [unclassified Microbulbifer]|uniref:DUF4880 domain-containing protein n=1 Tax=Microbulbifer spongiae TaxID=2944933 RepID=A0ABY9EGM5_9GAMM|nr:MULTISPECIES: DUF4880 domain-containing protein [unclassified Microbulbifer]MDP5211266.1 DUF4880 domain-containing protein [Microbulbifer sp. 2205BS26-8]WKD51241.1 DUF4880 domain-containing protein [Microbulbifer sp. MI-G]
MKLKTHSNYKTLRAAAIYWFNEQQAGDMHEQARCWFTQWLNQTQENRLAYRQMECDWAFFNAVAEDAAILAARQEDRNTFLAKGVRCIALLAATTS